MRNKIIIIIALKNISFSGKSIHFIFDMKNVYENEQ